MTQLLPDGQPRFKLVEQLYRGHKGEQLDVLILDRAYCHEVVWKASSADLRGLRTSRIEATRRRGRGALYEIDAETAIPGRSEAISAPETATQAI